MPRSGPAERAGARRSRPHKIVVSCFHAEVLSGSPRAPTSGTPATPFFSVFGHEFVRIQSPKPLKVYAADKLCPGPGPVRFSDLKRQLQRKVMS